MKEWVKEHSPDTKNKVLYAISQDNPQVVPPEKCRYDVCFVTNEFKEDTTVFHGELPNGNYTIYTIPHTAEVVQKFYSNIGELMKQVKFDDKRPIMERYETAPSITSSGTFIRPNISLGKHMVKKLENKAHMPITSITT